MKKIILGSLIISCTLFSCTTNDEITIDNNNELSSDNRMELLNRLSNSISTNENSLKRQSITQIISQAETLAFQDQSFVSIVNNKYVTPKAEKIEEILIDPDTALDNVVFNSNVKSYIIEIIDAIEDSKYSELENNILIDSSLTSDNKNMLLDILSIQIDGNHNGDDEDWRKRKIIGYVQGYNQSQANAIINYLVVSYAP